MLTIIVAFSEASFAAEQIQQFANKAPAAWQNGNLNSINSSYVEGSCVPFRYEINGIPNGSDVHFEIHYDFTKGGVYAFDYLTGFGLTEGGVIASNGGLFAGTPLTTAPRGPIVTNALAIPDDATIHTDNLLASQKGTQYFTLVGFYTNAYVLVPPTFAGSSNTLGDSDKYLTIVIQGITNGQITIAWAGHIAVGGAGNWPLGKGAGSISGSPFHQNGDGYIVANNAALSTANRSMSAGTVTPDSDLELTKSASTAVAYVNDLVYFTVVCTNKGPSDATLVAVRDLLPTGLAYVSNSLGSAYAPLTGTWTIGTLPANASTQLVIAARVTTATVITNFAQVSASQYVDPDSTPNNNFLGTPVSVRLPLEDDEAFVVLTTLPVADLSLAKRVSNPYAVPGSPFTFTLTVTNAGPNTATNVTVQDILPAGFSYVSGGGAYNPTNGLWTVGMLASGAVATVQFTVTAPGGLYTNRAQVWTSGMYDPDSTPGNSVPGEDDDSSVSVNVTVPSVTVVKTAGIAADGDTHYVVAGTPVVYTYRVINTGNTYLTNITVGDDKLGAIGTVPGPLAPGATNILVATNAGVTVSVTNLATATATPSTASGVSLGVGTVQDTDNAFVKVVRPEIHLHKAASDPAHGGMHVPDGFVYYAPYGSNVLFYFHVHNYGDVALTNVTVVDDQLGYIGVIPFLATNAAAGLYVTNYNMTNSMVNVAVASGTPALDNGQPIPGLDPTPVVHIDTAIADVSLPGVRLIKTAGTAADGIPLFVLPGSNVVYTYAVIVTGDTAVTNAIVTDDQLGYVGVLPGPLAPGSTNYLYATHSNLTASVTNVGSVTAYPTNGLPPVTDAHAAFVFVVSPGVSLTKTAGLAPDGGTHYILPGSNVLYTYRVVNTGDTYLADITVTDDQLGFVAAVPGPLAPGSTTTVTQLSGPLATNTVNLGTVVAEPTDISGDPFPGIVDVTDTDPAAVQVVSPAVSVIKTAGAAADGGILYILPGSNVLYTYRVINSGNTWLTNVVVTDDRLGPVGVIPGPVAPGSTNTLTLSAGILSSVTNIGTASATPSLASGAPLPGLGAVSGSDDAAVQVVKPAVTLVKTAGATADGAVHYVVSGAPVVYAFEVINSGDTHLVNLNVMDDKLGAIGFIPGPLAPGASVTLYATNIGVLASVTNIGTVVGTPAHASGAPIGGIGAVQDTDSATVRVVRPEIHLHKAASHPEDGGRHVPDGFVHYTYPGSNVLYYYHVHNYGDTALTNITVTDDKLGFIGTIPLLQTNQQAGLYVTNYNFTSYVLNVAVATGTPAFPSGQPIPGVADVTHSDTAVADVSLPGVQLIKTAGNAPDGATLFVLPGSDVVYTYAVIVTGDAALTNVTVTDDKLGDVGMLAGPLAPGTTNYLYATNYDTTVSVTNLGSVIGYPTNGLAPVTDDHPARVQVVSPRVSLVKTAGLAPDGGTHYILSGSPVLYTYRVVNTGDTFLKTIQVTDDQLGLVGTVAGPLAPGGTNTFTLSSGPLTSNVLNIGTVSAVPCDASADALAGIPGVTNTDPAVVQVVAPDVTLIKTAGDAPDGDTHYILSGSAVGYTYRVINSGDTWLTNVVVTDDKLGAIGVLPGPLAPGSTNVLTATNLSVTASVTNIGSAVGTPSLANGTPLAGVPNAGDTDSAAVQVVTPGVTVVKTAGGAADGAPLHVLSGASVLYTYRVVNTGNTWLSGISVTDDKVGVVGTIPGPVAPGATNILYTNVNITASVTNIGTAAGTPSLPDGTPLGVGAVQDSDDAVTLVVGPAVSLTKTAGNTADGAVHYVVGGTPVVYTFRVVNAGDTWLTGLSVTDDKLGFIGSLAGPLAPGSTNYLSATNLGVLATVTNTGAVTATPSAANGASLGVDPVEDADDAVVQVMRPEIHLHKAASKPENGGVHVPDGFVYYTHPGSNVLYYYHVHNYGDTALTNITVTDDKLGYIGTIPLLLTNQSAGLYVTNYNFTNYVLNVGVATGTPAFFNGQPIPGLAPVVHSDTAVADVASPGVFVLKTAGNAKDGEPLYVLPGTDVVYTYMIVVNGDSVLTNVTVNDDVLGPVGVLAGPLEAGSTNYLYATNLNVTTSMVNVAYVTGYPTNGLPPVNDSHPAFVSVVSPDISLVKTADATPDGDIRYIRSGSDVTYTYTFVNTGDTYLTNVTVTDAPLGLVGTFPSPLAPGATGVLTKTAFNVTATVTNTGTVTGSPADANSDPLPGIPNVQDSDQAITEVVDPAFNLFKILVSEGKLRVGDTATFEIVVFNSGDVTLVTVPVEDRYDTSELAFIGAVPAADDPSNDGVLNWSNLGPLAPGAYTNILVTFTAVGSTVGGQGTNIVVAVPTTPPDRPGVPPRTNSTPYDASAPGYTLGKTLTSPLGRAAQVGESVVFTLTVANTGDVALEGVPLEDRYDTNSLAFAGAVPAPDLLSDGMLTWYNLGPLAAGASTSVVVTFTAAGSTAGTNVENVAIATPVTGQDEPDVPAQTSSVPYRVSAAGFSVAKSIVSPAGRSAAVGETLVFQLTVSNTGDVPLASVPVSDVYQTAYLAFTSAVPATVDNVNDGIIDWADVGPLAPGQSTNLLVSFRAVQSTAGQSVSNAVIAAPVTPPGEPGVPPATNRTEYGVSLPAYRVVKTLLDPANRPPIVGETLTFGIRVSNTGDVAMAVVRVEDVFRSDFLTFASAAPAPDSAAPGLLVWNNVGPLAPGASTNLEVVFTGTGSTTGLVERNVAVILPQPPAGEPLFPVLTNDAPYEVDLPGFIGDKAWLDLDLDGLQDGGEPGLPGVTVRLYDAASNLLDTAVTDGSGLYAFTNRVPASYFLVFEPVAGYVFTLTGQGSSSGLDSDPDPATGVTLIEPLVPGEYDPNWDAGYVATNASVEVIKTAGAAADGEPLYVQPGADVTYTFLVTNAGPTHLTNVVVDDDVLGPVGTVPLLAPGDWVLFTAVHSNVQADVINTALAEGVPVFGNGAPIPGVGPVSGTDSAETRVTFLSVVKEDSPDPVRPGGSLTYTLWVANPSPHPITGVTVTEQYPAAFAFESAAPAPSVGQNVWELGDLAPGQVAPIVISGRALALTGDTLTNVATVVSTNGGAYEVTETTRVMDDPGAGRAELRVTKRDDADPVQPGGALTYTIRIENLGPAPASNVVVTETYDPLFAFGSAAPAPVSGASNVWNLGRLAVNAYVEIAISGIVSSSAPNGYLVHNVAGAQASNAAPAADAEVTVVGTQPPPDVRKTASLNPVLGGQTLVYTVTVENVSSVATVSNVTVVETYDPLFLFGSSLPAPQPGVSNVWHLGDLPPGFTTNIVITGVVSEDALREDVLFNTVEVISLSGSRTVHLTTRVINAPPIPVTLLFFRAVTTPDGVRLKWETATEYDNLGFNLYRSETPKGKRVKVNRRLVPGANSLSGQRYAFLDATAAAGATYYYWLEEVAVDYQTTLYGPAIRWGPGPKPAGVRPALGTFRTSTTGGLYRVRYETLAAAGLPLSVLDAGKLAIRVNGASVPVFLDATGPVMQPGDSLLFYVKASKAGWPCEVAVEARPLRMRLADAAPVHGGDVYVARAGERQRVWFGTSPDVSRYMLIDFADAPVWVLDVTQPTNAVLMTGYAYAGLTNGLTAVYLSYEPASGSARCLAVQDGAVLEVPAIRRVK